MIEDVSFKLKIKPIYESLEYAVQGKGASMSCNHKFYICIFQELFQVTEPTAVISLPKMLIQMSFDQ